MSNWTANYHCYRKTIDICDNISHAFMCLLYLRRRSTLQDAPTVQKSANHRANPREKIIIWQRNSQDLPFSFLDEPDR